MAPWLSVVIPTAGQRQEGLLRTLDSIRAQSGADRVEVLVVADTHALGERRHLDVLRDRLGDYPHGWRWLEHDGGINMVGQPQRNFGARQATGEWVAFSQDDNILTQGSLNAIWMAVCEQPHRRPLFFRVMTAWRQVIWAERVVALHNIDADCVVLPKTLASEVTWGMRYEGDFDAAADAARRAANDIGWCEDLVAIARPEPGHIWWP